jgi:hypothetical protein
MIGRGDWSKPMRWFAIGIGVLVTLFGLACLNYTNGFGIEHHAEWARARGMPEPAYALFVLGAAASVVGAAATGYAIAAMRLRGRRPGAAALGVPPAP